jgi:hypothetical protein
MPLMVPPAVCSPSDHSPGWSTGRDCEHRIRDAASVTARSRAANRKSDVNQRAVRHGDRRTIIASVGISRLRIAPWFGSHSWTTNCCNKVRRGHGFRCAVNSHFGIEKVESKIGLTPTSGPISRLRNCDLFGTVHAFNLACGRFRLVYHSASLATGAVRADKMLDEVWAPRGQKPLFPINEISPKKGPSITFSFRACGLCDRASRMCRHRAYCRPCR